MVASIFPPPAEVLVAQTTQKWADQYGGGHVLQKGRRMSRRLAETRVRGSAR